MSMCRFQSRADEGYKQIVGEMTIIISDIQRRMKQVMPKKGREPADLGSSSPSQTTASTAYCT
jgi:hypothetical protein